MDCILSPENRQDYEAWLDSLPPGWPAEPAEPAEPEALAAQPSAQWSIGYGEGFRTAFTAQQATIDMLQSELDYMERRLMDCMAYQSGVE